MADFPLLNEASLVMIPGAYKEGKIYSQLPTDGSGDFTFTRGTDTATRVNEAGNIEKGYENTLLQSNNWAQSDSQYEITGGEAGYDGTNDAWLVNKLAAAYFSKDALVLTGVMTISFYAKAGSLDRIFVFIGGDAARFDLTNGTAVSAGGNPVSQNIELVSGTTDWYRCSIVLNKTSTQNLLIKPQNSSNQDVTGTIYIQDAQLNQGLVAYSYLETTTVPVYAGLTDNMPRLDYSGGASCPALLLEPQRTNLDTQSEYIAGWNTASNVTRTANYEESPEGVNNATRLEFTANGYTYNGSSPSQVNGSTYTMSCYAKRNDSGTQDFGFFRDGSGTPDSVMALTSEWQRFEYTYTAGNTSRFGLAGKSGADVSVYGFQIEKDASYATSYIPTYGSAVTRNNDTSLVAGVSDIIGQTEGTLYFEAAVIGVPTDTQRLISLSNCTTNESIQIQVSGGSDKLAYVVLEGGVQQMVFTSVDITLGTTFKTAIAYAENDFAVYLNGTLVGTDNSGNVPVDMDKIVYGRGNETQFCEGEIKQTMIFKTRLLNEELAALTTI